MLVEVLHSVLPTVNSIIVKNSTAATQSIGYALELLVYISSYETSLHLSYNTIIIDPVENVYKCIIKNVLYCTGCFGMSVNKFKKYLNCIALKKHLYWVEKRPVKVI